MLASRLTLSIGALSAVALFAACGGTSPGETGSTSTSTGTTTTTTSDAAAGTGSGGGGGVGGGGVGGGGTGGEAFMTAMHPAPPKVVSIGGKVLKTPKVVAITYTSDPHEADIDAFLNEAASTSYWAETTSEYGVGPLTVSPPIHLDTAAPATTDDATLTANLAAQLSGPNPAWGPADANTIYLFVLPEGSIIDSDGKCCDSFDGYHDEAMVGAGSVAYAVVCSCPGFDGKGIDPLAQVTIAMSHEIVEAATDPFVQTNAAFGQNDDKDAVWTVVTGGETADMCEYNNDAYFTPPGAKYKIQRTWSNAAALAGKNPCVPVPMEPYFNSAPVLTDPVTIDFFGAWNTQGVKIPVGQSKTIDVDLFSDAATQGPWKVTAYDYNSAYTGGPKLLDLSLDKDTGSNGDVLKLTIKVLATDKTLKGEAFILESDLGTQSNLWMGIVGN
jgi:hypothetical protein